MTEDELAQFLRIPVLSNAKSQTNVIENLKRYHDLPCIHICRKPLYPLGIIRQWVEDKYLGKKDLIEIPKDYKQPCRKEKAKKYRENLYK